MLITCKCINICLEVKEMVSFQHAFTEVERQNEFFKKGQLNLVHVTKVRKEQPFLTEDVTVGSWVICSCTNCLTPLFATNQEKIGNAVLVSKDCVPVSEEELAAIKTCEDYSDIFKVIITEFSDRVSEGANGKGSYKTVITALEKQLEENINLEGQRMEKKIQKFAEEQHALLQEYKIRARNEYESLVRILSKRYNGACSGDEAFNMRPEDPGNNIASDSKQKIIPNESSSVNNAPIDVPKIKSKGATDGQVKHHRNNSQDEELKHFYNIPASFDSEALFPLDGMDTTLEEDNSDDDLTDTDVETDPANADEGIYIPRRNSHIVARSLPVKVPAAFDGSFDWLDEIKSRRNFQEEPECPEDIAASIKALANSVHGDTLLGDLPPPRIGSRI